MFEKMKEAQRRRQVLIDIDKTLARMNLGMSAQEKAAMRREKFAMDALAGFLCFLCAAGIVFALTEPKFGFVADIARLFQ